MGVRDGWGYLEGWYGGLPNRVSRLIFCVGLLLSCLTADAGRTLYVSPTGDDASAAADDRTRPFKSMPAAFGSLRNGDRLEIQEGDYTITPGYPTTYFPLPDYAPMRVDSLTNVVIAGMGEVEIYGEGPGDFLMIQNSSAIRVENLTFKGNRPSIPEDVDNALFSTIQLRGTNNGLHFENCRITGFGDHGISHLWGPKTSFNMVVTNCYFADGGDGNFSILGEDGAAISGISSSARIVNNTFERCFRGIEVEGVFDQTITNVLIEGNILTNCHSLGIMLFATDHWGLNLPNSYSDIRVLNNTISKMSVHPDSPPSHVLWGIWLLGGEKLQISGNRVEDIPKGVGISVTSSQMAVNDVVITSNVVEKVGLRGIQVYQLAQRELKNPIVSDNRVKVAGDEGILLNGRNIVCEGNHVEDTGWQGQKAAITVQNYDLGSDDVRIADNVIRNVNDYYSDYGIWLEGGATNCVVYGNTFANVPLGAIRDDGVDSALLPKIKELEKEDVAVSLTVTGTPGTVYKVEVSNDLSSWMLVRDLTCPSSGVFNAEYVASPSRFALRPTFFRVATIPVVPE